MGATRTNTGPVGPTAEYDRRHGEDSIGAVEGEAMVPRCGKGVGRLAGSGEAREGLGGEKLMHGVRGHGPCAVSHTGCLISHRGHQGR